MKRGLLYIWSKDRACQLDTLLCSVYQNKLDVEFDIEVLYATSNEQFEAGYSFLQKSYKNILFTKQVDTGKNHFIDSINNYYAVCIATDDCWVYRPVPCTILDKLEDVATFSLRLGLNTIVQDPFKGALQPSLTNYIQEEYTLKWDYTKINTLLNYGYPFATDMHIYKTDVLMPFVLQIEFNHPPHLEGRLVQFSRNLESTYMRSFHNSIAVNIPLNCMSGNTEFNGPSLEELNNRFLNGERLIYIPTQIVGCHQNVPYNFYKI